MKRIKTLFHSIHNLNRKEIFLLGYYISFLIIMTLAVILDSMFENYIDVYVELFFILLTLMSILYYLYRHDMMIAIYNIVIIAVLTTYALLLSNHHSISAFHSIVPLGFFLLFSLRRSLIYSLLHHMVVTVIFVYEYFAENVYPMVHDPVTLVSTELTSLMVILFGIVYHLSVENSYRLLATSNHQKELLLKEVHHRVKNNLNIISSMLGLQMLREEDRRIKEILEKNKHRIKSIALVHEILYKHEDFAHINIHEYLERLANTLLDVYDKEVTVAVEGLHQDLPFEQALRIGIITNELIVNSIKYALDDKEPSIRMRIDETQTHYLFHYEDSHTSPVDMPDGHNKKSLGLRFINMMVKQLDADMSVKRDSGLIYTLWIPKHVH